MTAGAPLSFPPFAKATRVRFRVVALVTAFGMVTYFDRACIASLAPAIMAEFSLTKVQMGFVFTAFAIAYAAFEIPTGLLVDRKGARVVLTRIVIWWSVFTMLTGAAVGLVSLLVTRFLFGAGEAGAWPGMARTFSRWIPLTERGRVQGIFFAGAHLAGGLTPFVVAGLMMFMSWRGIFVCFGALGFVWATIWYVWFRDDPEQHSEVNPAERQVIIAKRERPSTHQSNGSLWRELLGNRSLAALCVMYFPNSFAFYFCITWLPTYLTQRHGLSAGSLVFFTGLPLLLSMIADLCGGFVTDHLTARFGVRIGRCVVGCTAYLLAGSCLLITPAMHQPMLAASLIALATAASMFSLAAAWGSCSDLGQENVAVVSATMNTSGQVGSLLCPLVVAYSLKWYGSWDISIRLMGLLFLMGAIAWLVIQPEQRLRAATRRG